MRFLIIMKHVSTLSRLVQEGWKYILNISAFTDLVPASREDF
jgi:hypothetical protein